MKYVYTRYVKKTVTFFLKNNL